MSKIERLAFDSWDTLKRELIPLLFGRGSFQSGRFLFRGCGSVRWSLTSSFDRRFEHLTTEHRLAIWKELVDEYRSACLERGVPSSITSDDRRLLAYGQHYGLPTRLLDWSLSPYVACFFAFRQALTRRAPGDRVALWVLDASSSAWSSELGVEVVAPPALQNVRLLNQSGRFTYARTHFPTLEEYVASAGAAGAPLMQISLPADEAVRALPDLDAMGVNPVQLFPDEPGLAETVALRVQVMSIQRVVALP